MKRLSFLYGGTFLLFALLFVITNVLQKNREEQSNQGRNIVMNRIAYLVEAEMEASGTKPEAIVQSCFYDKKEEWQQAYNESMLPNHIVYLSPDTKKSGVNNVTDTNSMKNYIDALRAKYPNLNIITADKKDIDKVCEGLA